MATPVEEEELREIYYIRCRNEGYTNGEASERSLAYIKRILNADKSLATTGYLEEAYQNSISRPQYFSTPSSYDDDLLRRSGSLGNSRDRNRHEVLCDFSEMRKQHEKDCSVPGRRAPEYIPSPYDYRNNAPESRSESYKYPRSHDKSTSPLQSTYGCRTYSCSGSYYTTEYRQPSSTYEYYAPDFTYSSYPPLKAEFKPYESPDLHTAASSHSFRPSARPSDSYTRSPPPPGAPLYSTFDPYSGPFRNRTPPSTFYARPSPPRCPIPPRPKDTVPTTDLYTVLGVTRNATAAEIKKAHRALSLRWHPDRCTGQDEKEATEKMAEVNHANDVLGNEVKRRFYDLWGVLPSEC